MKLEELLLCIETLQNEGALRSYRVLKKGRPATTVDSGSDVDVSVDLPIILMGLEVGVYTVQVTRDPKMSGFKTFTLDVVQDDGGAAGNVTPEAIARLLAPILQRQQSEEIQRYRALADDVAAAASHVKKIYHDAAECSARQMSAVTSTAGAMTAAAASMALDSIVTQEAINTQLMSLIERRATETATTSYWERLLPPEELGKPLRAFLEDGASWVKLLKMLLTPSDPPGKLP